MRHNEGRFGGVLWVAQEACPQGMGHQPCGPKATQRYNGKYSHSVSTVEMEAPTTSTGLLSDSILSQSNAHKGVADDLVDDSKGKSHSKSCVLVHLSSFLGGGRENSDPCTAALQLTSTPGSNC